MKQKYLFIILSCLFLAACSSGQKKLEQGDYDTAVYKAVKRLQQKPNHGKASKVLREAYTLAVERHMDEIKYLDEGNRAFKYDGMVEHYHQVDMLNRSIKRYPAYASLITLVDVTNEIAFTEKQAANAHYNEGERLLDKGTKAFARGAHFHFSRASFFTPGNTLIYDKMEEALIAGTVVVGLDFASDRRFFKNFRTERVYDNLARGLNNMNYTFLQVVNANDPAIIPDEILFIDMEEAYIGGVNVNRDKNTVSKSNVLMGEQKTDSGTIEIFGTVTADYIEFTKTIRSNASILVQTVDANSNAVIKQNIIPNSYCWTERWATYRGDKRALSDAQLRMACMDEPRIPDHQWIFAQTTAPLANSACSYIQGEYGFLR